MTMFGIVEIMGHRTRAGAISDAQMGGATLLRIEHPTRVDHTGAEPLAEFYAPAAIFSIRPCSEDEATKVAAWAWSEPVSRPALGPAFRELVDAEIVDDDEDLVDEPCECDDENCECDDENCPECENRMAAARSHEEPF